MPGKIATASKLDALLEEYTQDPYTQLPRAVLMVADRNGIIYEKATGPEQVPKEPSDSAARKNDVTTSSIFELWSCTKLVTTLACLYLIEKGDMSPEDDVARWLPEVNELKVLKGYEGDKPVLENVEGRITVKMLMTHTMGSALDFGPEASPDYHRYLSEELGFTDLLSVYLTVDAEKLQKIPLVLQPGTSFTYGYSQDWAALLIEKITGQKLEAFLNEILFKPLGIDDMTYGVNPKKVNWAAEGPDGKYTYMDALPRLSPGMALGGAGLSGSAKSYIRLVQLVLNGGEYEGKRILKQSTIDLMFQVQHNEAQTAGLQKINSLILTQYLAALGISEIQWEHGYGGAWPKETIPGGRGKGDIGWTGASSTYWLVSPDKGVAYVLFVNLFPVYSKQGSKLLVELEKAIFDGVASARL